MQAGASGSIWRLAPSSTLQLMPVADTFDLWLADNQPGDGHATLADPGDALLKVGTYALVSGRHRLSVTLGPAAFTAFYPDRAFVVRADRSPVDSFVLTGSSTVFARLRRRQVRFVDEATAPPGSIQRRKPRAKRISRGSWHKVVRSF